VGKEVKRLLIITDYFHPHWTGIVSSICYLIRAISSEFNIKILTTRYDPSLLEVEELWGAKVFRVSPMLRISRTYWSPIMIFRSIKLILESDVVLINSPCSNILPVSFLTKILGRRLVIFHQGDLILTKGFLNRVVEMVFDVCTKISARLADTLSTYTLDYAEHSRILKPFLYKFIPALMPVDIADEKTGETDLLLSSKGQPIFGFAGRFVEEKGFDILFKAIPEILKSLPNAIFLFAGEVNIVYEKFLDRTRHLLGNNQDKVLWLGLLSGSKLRAFYDLIDFLIIPSRSDCFPLVQVEAQLLGVPTISSDIPGLRVLPQATGFGAIFKPEDPCALAQSVVESVKNREMIMGKRSNVAVILDRGKILETWRKILIKF